MKRLSIRLGIIGVLMASGILAIAQAKRDKDAPEVPIEGPDQLALMGGATGDVSPPAQATPTVPQPVIEDPSLAPTGMPPMGVAPVQGFQPDPTANEYAGAPTPYEVQGAPPNAPPPSPGVSIDYPGAGTPIVEVTPPPAAAPPAEPYGAQIPGADAQPGVSGLSDVPPIDPSSPAVVVTPPVDPSVPLVETTPAAPGVQGLSDGPGLSDAPPVVSPGGLGDVPPIDPSAPAGLVNVQTIDPTVSPSNPGAAADVVTAPPVDPGTPAGLSDVPPINPGFAADPGNPIESAAPSTPAGLADVPPLEPIGVVSTPPLEPGMVEAVGPTGPDGPTVAVTPDAGDYPQAAPRSAEPYLADSTGTPVGVGGPLAASGQPTPSDAGSELPLVTPAPADYAPEVVGGSPAAEAMPGTANNIAPVAASEQDELRSAPVPGDRQLEGQQTPFVSIEKRAPQEIRVGQPATFEIVVRNSGQVAAQDVTVIDQVPQGTQFIDATPQPQQLPNGALVWSFGAIEPGQDRTVSLRLMPQQEGEIGSVAKVICQSQASVRTVCTRPELTLKQTAPSEVLIGDELQVLVEVSNPGTGAAENVVLEADLPAGLAHRKGRELYYAIGTLQPKETRAVRLHLATEQAGISNLALRASAGNIEQQDAIEIQVVAPNLQTRIMGPAKRYLRREAAFELELANPGTATARDIQAVVYLPQGLQYKSASHQGRYQPQNHAIVWRLEELPQGKSGKVQFAALPVTAGDQSLRAEARGNLNTSASGEHTLSVESLNELVFTVADVNDPIEVGSETMYEIRVTNNGSKTDGNVEVVAQLPAGLRLVNADGPTKHQVEGEIVSFAPLARLAPNGEAVYRLAVQGSIAGDHRLRVQIRSAESPTPVAKEEVTRVYQDR